MADRKVLYELPPPPEAWPHPLSKPRRALPSTATMSEPELLNPSLRLARKIEQDLNATLAGHNTHYAEIASLLTECATRLLFPALVLIAAQLPHRV